MRILFALMMLATAAGAAETPPFPGDPESGWVYVQHQCAGCHGQTGPRAFKVIADQRGMTGTALLVWLTSSEHHAMPHLILKPEDARNVVAYILSLKAEEKK